jgi:hypothetical protein
MNPKEADLSPVRSQVLDRGYTNFYEKAHFVKPTWRLLCGVDATVLPFALCFYSHFGEPSSW